MYLFFFSENLTKTLDAFYCLTDLAILHYKQLLEREKKYSDNKQPVQL